MGYAFGQLDVAERGNGSPLGGEDGTYLQSVGEVESGCTFGQLRVAAMGYAFGQLKVAGRGGTGPRSGAGTERTSSQSKVAGSGYIFGLAEVVGMGLTGC